MSLLAVSVSTSALAQKILPHFDFKGISATTSLEEAKPKLQSVEAYYGANKGGRLIDDLVSGHHATINAVFDDQGLVTMHGYPSDYQETKVAFTMKWGAPGKITKAALQNGYGANIVSEKAEWYFEEGRMTLEDGGFRNPSFSYESNRQIKFIGDSDKVKVDF